MRFPGRGVELEGFLYLPEGQARRPGIVMLHGCGGFRNKFGFPNASYAFWAEHWRSQGFAVLMVDSLRPRGERELCTQTVRKVRASVERVADAYSALDWLAGLESVDAARIVVLGWSNGATTALHALRAGTAEGLGARQRFLGGVAFYPGCRALGRREYAADAPVLIQAGGADDWTPASHCQALAARAGAAGQAVDIDVYPEAHHGFDRIGLPTGERAAVYNPNRPGGRGATLGTHETSRRAAIERATAWVRALAG